MTIFPVESKIPGERNDLNRLSQGKKPFQSQGRSSTSSSNSSKFQLPSGIIWLFVP